MKGSESSESETSGRSSSSREWSLRVLSLSESAITISISTRVKGAQLAITGRQEWRHVPAVPDGYTQQQSDLLYRHCGRRLTSGSCSFEGGDRRAKTRKECNCFEVIATN
jgi:hypothetical protein